MQVQDMSARQIAEHIVATSDDLEPLDAEVAGFLAEQFFGAWHPKAEQVARDLVTLTRNKTA
jgi:hypothetical protein